MLMKPAIHSVSAITPSGEQIILESRLQANRNILVSKGLKFSKLSIDDSSSEYSFSVSDDRPTVKTLPR